MAMYYYMTCEPDDHPRVMTNFIIPANSIPWKLHSMCPLVTRMFLPVSVSVAVLIADNTNLNPALTRSCKVRFIAIVSWILSRESFMITSHYWKISKSSMQRL